VLEADLSKLDDILDSDLIQPFAPREAAPSVDDRVRQSFEEILTFVDRNGRAPAEAARSATERTLAIRLRKLREKATVSTSLLPIDRHGLLSDVAEDPQEALAISMDDILSSDLLDSPGDDIFTARHVSFTRSSPDFKAERRPCPDFETYRPLFEQAAREIDAGIRKTRKFANEQEIDAGQFYILNGVMAYVAEISERQVRNGKKNARLKVIFDNGTEGENLLRSLATELYKDPNGRRVLDPAAGPLFGSTVTATDVRTGCVYIARSLSTDDRVRSLQNLHKIGCTTGQPEARIRTAQDDPTFLMAPATLVRSYTLYNIPVPKVENLLHRFFSPACLDIEILDRFGKPIRPREWFLAPISALEHGIERLLDGTIASWRYDQESGSVVEKE